MGDESLGHFALLEKIGEGGMGRVYKARDTLLARLVAIKVLPDAAGADSGRRARFIQEARAASALNHPHIVTIHEIAEQAGQTFIVMELVDGRPLNELIPDKGMRLTEALRIAVQVADALAAAHAAGIVHRDLKPGNIMVDAHGRAKVLDFGLAKLIASAAAASSGADEATRTMAMERPRTEEGAILGSVPYMSPEQAEGKAVDSRSDIFSFGAVLYEMVTGRRAFRGESRASTLAAVVEKEPQPPSAIAATPPELERLIARCMRKDVNRRSQNMADVKLELEELRDESESGKLVRSELAPPAPAATRRWLWPAVAIGSILIAAAAVAWSLVNRAGRPFSHGPELVRLSPDDGYSYTGPSISKDGKFVAYTSDRSGSRQLWLQQVAGGDPIQLTHSPDPVLGGQFLPDGSRLVYATSSAGGKKISLEVIPTLGGQPRVVAVTNRALSGAVSPDGRFAAYFESGACCPPARLMLLSLDSGQPRELSTWGSTQPVQEYEPRVAWSSDNRYLLGAGTTQTGALNFDQWDWFALPVDGGGPQPTGAGDAIRSAGLTYSVPALMTGDRVLFTAGTGEAGNVWEIRLSPQSWRVRGAPRRLTFGAENQAPFSVSADGTVASSIFKDSADLYLIPLSPASGQPTGIPRRLTHDGRMKVRFGIGGDPGSVYFALDDSARNIYALDLASARQSLLYPGDASRASGVLSPDGRVAAYSALEGASYAIYLGDAGAALSAARLLSKDCGRAVKFSADGRFLFCSPEVKVKPDPRLKYTFHLLDVATGRHRPWLEHPSDSLIYAGPIGEGSGWVVVRVRPVGASGSIRTYLVPWRQEPVPAAEWIEVQPSPATNWNHAATGNYFQYFEGEKLMTLRFDPKTGALSRPEEVKYLPGTAVTPKPDDPWLIRGPGLVFWRRESNSSVWLMQLPR